MSLNSGPFHKNMSEIRSFLGLCSYYRAFCQNFVEITAPLREMLRTGQNVEETDDRILSISKNIPHQSTTFGNATR